MATGSILSTNPSLHTVAEAARRGSPQARMRAAAQDFEASYLNSMLGTMFAGLPTDGDFHGGQAEETWRGMLVEQYSKSIAARGGIGIADAVYREMVRMQEAHQS